MKSKDKPEIFKNDKHLRELFHFVIQTLNILQVYYIYENY